MPRSSGTYSAPPSSWSPAVSGNAADFGDWNTLLADLSSALTQSLSQDGQTNPTANLPMAGFRHTGAGNASGTGQYLVYGQSGAVLDALTVTTLSSSGLTTANSLAVTNASTFSGALRVIGASALGYGAGAGGTVTQATDKATPVTLNKPTGQITMNAAALAAGATVTFQVNNSLITTADTVLLTCPFITVGPNNYRVEVSFSSNGSFNIRVTNISVGSLSEALVINFALIKGATA